MKDEIKKFISSLEGTELRHPYGKKIEAYYIEDKMFAVVEYKKFGLVLSLRCDRNLIETLVNSYDEVMLGHKLNQKQWISIVPSGQLDVLEIEGLIRHSYLLASGSTHLQD